MSHVGVGLEESLPTMSSKRFRAGDLIADKYVFERVIGEGSLGFVIAATQLNLDECVAIKFLHPHAATIPDIVARFAREARTAVRIKSEHCVRVLDVGALQDGTPFLVMEYLEGRDLRTALAQAGTFSPLAATTIALQACEALAIAHSRGIVHRDVKPENLFLAERDGNEIVKVLDFGISKAALTPLGSPKELAPINTVTLMGTPLYMSPEQIRSTGSVDHRADIWSLGVVLYELLTGTTPFESSSVGTAFHRVSEAQPTPISKHRSDVPADLVATIDRCLQKNPDDRFANMGELAVALLPHAGDYGHVCAERAMAASAIHPARASHREELEPSQAPMSLPNRRGKRGSFFWVAGALVAIGAVVAGALIAPRLKKSPFARLAPAPLAAPAASAAPVTPPIPVRGITESEVRVGMSGAFSGPSKELGSNMKLGMETAFLAANDEGGVHGRAVKLVALDDGYDAARTHETMRELLEERAVFAFVGNVGTPTAEVALPYAVEHKTLFYGAFTGAALLRQDPPDRYVINYRASYEEETAKTIRYLVENRHIAPTAIAVFAQQDAFGNAGFHGAVKALRKYGINETSILRVGYKRNTLDVEPAVLEIARNNALVAADAARAVDTASLARGRHTVRAVVMVASYRPAAKFIQKIREKKVDALFTNVSFVGSEALADELRELGPAFCKGAIVTQVVPHPDSGATAVLKYRELLAKYFPHESPGFVSLEGYVAGRIFLEALNRAGKDVDTESLITAFESIHDLDLGIGTKISFGLSEHQGSHKVWGTELDEGCRYRVLDMD
jgi:ABC-type branched-subunit amino acid transport system substrate-binding protein